ncbi:uncharacterized protein METZ01_LOCUS97187 [marine metagenome]|uniref:DUF998 domain-containing protein n=1 Tax=marine metagenome TaxID=408172 RepID=A0A381VXJ4_9ZZZZ
MIDSKQLILVISPRWCVGVFILLIILAMFLYPGGTYRDANTEGYILSQNFLSDLGRWSAWNGDQNFYSSFFFSFSFLMVGMVFSIYYWQLPSLFYNDQKVHLFSRIGSVAGILGGIFLVGVGLTPSDIVLGPHNFFATWFIRFFLVSALCYIVVFYRSTVTEAKYGLGYVFFAFLIAVYIGIIEFGPSIKESLSALKIQVISQKLICLTFILSVAFQTYSNKEVLGKRDI